MLRYCVLVLWEFFEGPLVVGVAGQAGQAGHLKGCYPHTDIDFQVTNQCV